MSFAVGALVKARGREWVVLPESTDDLLLLRPLGGSDAETTGICTALEDVEPASFSLPDPAQAGDHRSCRMLRDALRLGFRSSAGPFRSFGRIAVEPRPYQLVPLLMGLKLDPVRLLIADDVGIGKTVEALLVARELLDRGECSRLAVLCPPHLAEQWQAELKEKFHIDAELVLAGTVSRLERQCRTDESIFDVFPYTVVSLDFIKADRRRDDFLRRCPELVIVDEAHTCAFAHGETRGRHQRNDLVRRLAQDKVRHLILVTATPHSGKEEAFRSLLDLLSDELKDLPADLSGEANEPIRRRLAQQFVQRRRADIEHFLDEETEFPTREEAEDHYELTPQYKALFDRVLNYAREIALDETGGAHRQRVRWWSALALLRSLASSPAAAAKTLRNRSPVAGTETEEQANAVGSMHVLDQGEDDELSTADVTPGSDTTLEDDEATTETRRLRELARAADALRGDADAKLVKATSLIKRLVDDHFSPIVFCRFIDTAEYVGEQLRQRLGNRAQIEVITGSLPSEERERRIHAMPSLKEEKPHILVCTDCLSEGINLQEHFDAVMHYDLSWNPTRHEQREGRVDRFGQQQKVVRTLTYYGTDNQIDGIVLDVLLRKHKAIRSSLGISVPVPADTNAVVEAIFEGLLLRERGGAQQNLLPGLEEYLREDRETLHADWDRATDREKRSRTMFSQEGLQRRVSEVQAELLSSRQAIGSSASVQQFVADAVHAAGGTLSESRRDWTLDLSATPIELRDACGLQDSAKRSVSFDGSRGGEHLQRTHPLVEGLASYVLNTALDEHERALARRSGVIYTDAVERRTTLLLLRHRYHIITELKAETKQLLAEDCQLVAFRGSPENAQWLSAAEAEALLEAKPTSNIAPEQKRQFIQRVLDGHALLRDQLEQQATEQGESLLAAHKRVRSAANWRNVRQSIQPELPPDVLGIYVFLPDAGLGGSA
jgi:SNF2 family DNA or RNA helicase